MLLLQPCLRRRCTCESEHFSLENTSWFTVIDQKTNEFSCKVYPYDIHWHAFRLNYLDLIIQMSQLCYHANIDIRLDPSSILTWIWDLTLPLSFKRSVLLCPELVFFFWYGKQFVFIIIHQRKIKTNMSNVDCVSPIRQLLHSKSGDLLDIISWKCVFSYIVLWF